MTYPIVVACQSGAGANILQLLLDYQVNGNAINAKGEFALLLLAAAGETELLQVLIAVSDCT